MIQLQKALLSLNIHTSYFSYAVNYSHEYVTFWYMYLWNICTTIFEILKGTSFSQMSNFRRVKNSHVFVTPVKNSFEFFTCVTIRANFSHVWQIRSNVKVKRICNECEKIERICHTCEEFERFFTNVTNTCESFASVKDSHEFFTSVIRAHDMCDKFIKRVFVMRSYSRPLTSLNRTLVLWKKNVEETSENQADTKVSFTVEPEFILSQH